MITYLSKPPYRFGDLLKAEIQKLRILEGKPRTTRNRLPTVVLDWYSNVMRSTTDTAVL